MIPSNSNNTKISIILKYYLSFWNGPAIVPQRTSLSWQLEAGQTMLPRLDNFWSMSSCNRQTEPEERMQAFQPCRIALSKEKKEIHVSVPHQRGFLQIF